MVSIITNHKKTHIYLYTYNYFYICMFYIYIYIYIYISLSRYYIHRPLPNLGRRPGSPQVRHFHTFSLPMPKAAAASGTVAWTWGTVAITVVRHSCHQIGQPLDERRACGAGDPRSHGQAATCRRRTRQRLLWVEHLACLPPSNGEQGRPLIHTRKPQRVQLHRLISAVLAR